MLGIQEDERGLGGNCKYVKQIARFSNSEEKKQVVENHGQQNTVLQPQQGVRSHVLLLKFVLTPECNRQAQRSG